MKRHLCAISIIAALAAVSPVVAQVPTASPGAQPPVMMMPPTTPVELNKAFKTDKEQESYAMGMNYGMRLKNTIKSQELEPDIEAVVKGFRDSIAGATQPITETEEQAILNAMSTKVREKFAERRRQEAAQNLKESDAFFAKNKSAPGVVTTASGVQYKVIKAGAGDPPKSNDIVSIKFRSMTLDGKEYDDTEKHAAPEMPLEISTGDLFPGWSEAVQLMTPGSKWQVWVPPALAFGEAGLRTSVGPNQAVQMELELITNRPPPVANNAIFNQGPTVSDIIRVPSAEEMKNGAKIETIRAEDIPHELSRMTNK